MQASSWLVAIMVIACVHLKHFRTRAEGQSPSAKQGIGRSPANRSTRLGLAANTHRSTEEGKALMIHRSDDDLHRFSQKAGR